MARLNDAVSVMIVDDDVQVRRLLRRRLERGGYRVVEAAGGEAAVARYREAPTDLVITDLVMPDTSGFQLIERLRGEFPNVRIIAMSGAIDRGVPELLARAKRAGARQVLPKPFTTAQLLDMAREMMGNGHGGNGSPGGRRRWSRRLTLVVALAAAALVALTGWLLF